MKTFSFLLLNLLLACLNVLGQERSYTRFDLNDGLAGSTVYCVIQDQQGFLWFGTETGVSRFDGTHFKNFGTADGLPDNEILEMFQDSKGRIWMAPFKKTVCYYYKGKIYNAYNDTLIRKLQCKSHVVGFAEDDKGRILVHESEQLQLISEDGVKYITSINGHPIQSCSSISENLDGGFYVVEGESLYELKNDVFRHIRTFSVPYPNFRYLDVSKRFLYSRTGALRRVLYNLQTGEKFDIYGPMQQYNEMILGDSILVSNQTNGSTIYSINDNMKRRQYMADKPVSRTFIDNEGNYWFTTIGEGVYRLNSENMLGIGLSTYNGRKLGSHIVAHNSKRWLAGADLLYFFQLDFGSYQKKKVISDWQNEQPSRITALMPLDDCTTIVGSDVALALFSDCYSDSLLKIIKGETSVKSIFKKSDKEYLIATRSCVATLSFPELKLKDTIWNERATTVFFRSDTTYIGTLQGLYLVFKDKTKLFVGEKEPLFKNRLNAIGEAPDGILWMATNGAGVLGFKGGRIEKKITVDDGLLSNNCRSIWVNAKEMWVGTDKGLNRVIFQPGGFKIQGLTIGDGLSSNTINSIDVKGDTVAVATPEGITFFDANRISTESRCNLVLDEIIVSDRQIDPSVRSFSLRHRDNNIRFNYAGISFRAGGGISYNYRLIGLDTSWKTTKDNFLSYPTLPSGDYELQLQAENKFGVKSKMLSISFSVEQLLGEKTWFRLLLLFASIFIIWRLVTWRIRRIRKKDLEKSDIRRRMGELEQLALKSQMNPHFIFNSLNSIQQYVLDKDIAGSNKFITDFSKLIRQTLDISAKKEITLGEEITYLSTYLELEKTRLEDKFTYAIGVLGQMNVDEVFIPPMMLQPFVENSIRHGVRYRNDKNGKILISFNELEEELVCIIEDNGIGRQAALRHKSKNPIEYQSKGMSLIAARVEFLNQNASRPITIRIEDMEDSNKRATGTRVVMKFPSEGDL